MATLEKIRNRAGLLVSIIIGMALLAFVLGDLLSSGNSLFTNTQYEIAEVAGKSIPLNEYQKKVNNIEEFYKVRMQRNNLDASTMDEIHEMAWENMIHELVMENELKKLGVDISGEELFDLIQGDNPHQIIRQMFANQETGVINRSYLYEFLRRAREVEDGDESIILRFIENEIVRQRKTNKYLNLIRQGAYATTLEAKNRHKNIYQMVDFNYTMQSFNTIPDSEVEVSYREIKKYYKDHKHLYEQEESRDIAYVTFEVVPSQKDYEAAEKWINEIRSDFEEIEKTVQFINLNSDIPYNPANYKFGELPETINDFMFAAEVGDIYGPYFENEAYKLAKLVEINYLPDSVHARHILLPVNQNNVNNMFALADSLKKMLENGADFASLAKTNSADGTAQNGGDLGWFKESDMVRSLSDSVFFGNEGDIKIVGTQYGIHVVEILDQSSPVKKVQAGILVRNVDPSDETDQRYYREASEFAGLNNTYDKFKDSIEKQDVISKTVNNLKPMDKTISGLESPRDLIKWTFNADEHDISDVFKLGNNYVVSAVTKVREKGVIPLEDKRLEIELEVKKQKKAEKITEKIDQQKKEANSIGELASALGAEVKTATNINFNSRTIPGAGNEPKVIGIAHTIEPDVLSDAITGTNGVYVISVTSVEEVEEKQNYTVERNFIEREYAALANYSTYEVLRESADIEDHRIKFY